jgi:hypothetical protein
MSAFEQQGNSEQQPSKHQRRRRYSGTHPKSFNEKYKEHNLSAYPQNTIFRQKRASSRHIQRKRFPLAVGFKKNPRMRTDENSKS